MAHRGTRSIHNIGIKHIGILEVSARNLAHRYKEYSLHRS
jgi:hypothetical protein